MAIEPPSKEPKKFNSALPNGSIDVMAMTTPDSRED